LLLIPEDDRFLVGFSDSISPFRFFQKPFIPQDPRFQPSSPFRLDVLVIVLDFLGQVQSAVADFARSPFLQVLSAPNYVDGLLFQISTQENTAEEVLVYHLARLCHGVLAYDLVPSS
jgi:hypothetical protein